MTIRTDNQRASLVRRIRRFYDLLNARDFARCHDMIDPQVRDKASSVTLLQFAQSLGDFWEAVGPIRIQRIDIVLHLGQPSKLYSDRDFAVGQTTWTSKSGESHVFQERWVRVGRTWYTRTSGLIPPPSPKATATARKSTQARIISRSR